jgi:hypothetical protein
MTTAKPEPGDTLEQLERDLYSYANLCEAGETRAANVQAFRYAADRLKALRAGCHHAEQCRCFFPSEVEP